MSEKSFSFYCPNCIEPKTTIKYGDHVHLNVTAINYGSSCQVVMSCSVCGYVQDITKKAKQKSLNDILEILMGTIDCDAFMS